MANSDSESDGSPLMLASSTLAALADFRSEQLQDEKDFQALQNEETSEPLNLEEYRRLFKEDFQASQFWYSTKFALQLAHAINDLCTTTTKVAFLASPTAYVAFNSIEPKTHHSFLMEIDDRFAKIPKSKPEFGGYVHYDLNRPELVPKNLHDSVDIAIIDPPFLSRDPQSKVARTLQLILRKPSSVLIILTGTEMLQCGLLDIYASPPLSCGPIRRTKMVVEHEGDRLKNDFAVWCASPKEIPGALSGSIESI